MDYNLLHKVFPKQRTKIIAVPPSQATASPVKKEKELNHIVNVIITGNQIVDLVQLWIKWHQDHFIPLRAISLKPKLYERFFNFMNEKSIAQGKGELDKEAKLMLVQVDIIRGSALQSKDLYFERYYENHEQKDVYFGPDHNRRK